MAIHESAAKGFSAGADAYERGRPDYAPEAIDRLVRELRIAAGARVLDLAAGTGKLTRQLVETGAELVAVEPVAEMRAKLVAAVPGIEALDGTAERIPLPNHSVDVVVVGQAFHWFDGVRAVTEIRRVLRPGGGVGLIWQSREPSRPWIVRLNDVVDRLSADNPRFRSGAWREAFERVALFEPLEHASFEHVHRLTPETLVDRVASISYVAAAPEGDRRRVLDAVRDVLAADADTAGATEIDLPYRADVYWTRPRTVPTARRRVSSSRCTPREGASRSCRRRARSSGPSGSMATRRPTRSITAARSRRYACTRSRRSNGSPRRAIRPFPGPTART
jgi:SAM-dependent methyltransferase